MGFRHAVRCRLVAQASDSEQLAKWKISRSGRLGRTSPHLARWPATKEMGVRQSELERDQALRRDGLAGGDETAFRK